MELRKMKINNSYFDVVSLEEYNKNKSVYDDKHTAIITDGYALPVLPKSDTESIGIRVMGLVNPFNPPVSIEDKEAYSLENAIDMSKPTNYREYIEATQKLKNVEREILLNVDNKTVPIIGNDDTPQMRGLKEAITRKNCDCDSYSHRFGSNYPNDKRALKDNDISMKKLIRFGNAMDMKMTLTIEDSNPDVPNPMGNPVKVILTGGDYSDD